MAVRNILHRNKLDEFKAWLGDRSLPLCGKWELVRWKGSAGQPMRIIFDNVKSCEHLSCNDAALKDVRAFIEERKISEVGGTQPTTTNSRYKSAMDVYVEYCESEAPKFKETFDNWLRERLHSAKAPNVS